MVLRELSGGFERTENRTLFALLVNRFPLFELEMVRDNPISMSNFSIHIFICKPFVTLRPNIFSKRDCLRVAAGFSGGSFSREFSSESPWVFSAQLSSQTDVTRFEFVTGIRSWPVAIIGQASSDTQDLMN